MQRTNERLTKEGLHIWGRNASLNALGAQTWRDKKNFEGELVTGGKQRRFRFVKRLMMKTETEESMKEF